MVDILLLVLSGMVLWKPVQFDMLRTLMGNYEIARYVHFTAMTLLAAFVVLHIVMALVVPRSLLAMIRGK